MVNFIKNDLGIYDHHVKQMFDFLKLNQELLDSHNFDELYSKISESSRKQSVLTYVLINSGIDPLQYVSKIWPYMYYNLNIKEITIPFNISDIDTGAFWECSMLESVVISDQVTEIRQGAFMQCTKLTHVDLPSKLLYIADCAFSSCKSLTSVKIKYGVTRIKQEAFSFCDNLTTVDIPHTVMHIGTNAFLYANLKEINYDGKKEEFDRIHIGDTNTYAQHKVVIHCIDGNSSINL